MTKNTRMTATYRPSGLYVAGIGLPGLYYGLKGIIIWWARVDRVWLPAMLPVRLTKTAGTASAAGIAAHLSCLLLDLLQGSNADLLEVPTGQHCCSLPVLLGLAGLHGGGEPSVRHPARGGTGLKNQSLHSMQTNTTAFCFDVPMASASVSGSCHTQLHHLLGSHGCVAHSPL